MTFDFMDYVDFMNFMDYHLVSCFKGDNMKKKSPVKTDSREHCAQCAIIYEPKMHPVRNSRSFIALTPDNPRKPSTILVIPKSHLYKYADLAKDKKLSDDVAEFLGLLQLHCRENLGAKEFRVAWIDGFHTIKVAQPFLHTNRHLHASISIIYP